MKNNKRQAAPAEIYLQLDGDGGDKYTGDAATWAEERVYWSDVKYKRAAIAKETDARQEQRANFARYMKLNTYHCHEVMDRCDTLCGLIEDILISHVACDAVMAEKCEQAQRLIYEVSNEACQYSEIVKDQGK